MASVPPAHIIPDEQPEPNSSDQDTQDKENAQKPLALPAPLAEVEETRKLDVGSGDPLKLDHLGPAIVNSDGTLSRIQNWPSMTEMERERAINILGKRNKLRMGALKESGVTPQ